MTHALLSPSGAHRWLACPPSARLGEKFPDEPSVYAIEGAKAHEIAEVVLRARLNGENVPENVQTLEAANTYADYVLELIGTQKHVPVSLEVRSDYSAYIPDGFGIADCVLVLEDVIHVIDFKYGMGVKVSAKDNPQLKLYALGVLDGLKDILDITKISVHIVQPRIQNIDSDVMSVQSLLDWAKSIRPVAELAWKGEGDFSVGEHCRFCRAKERLELNILRNFISQH